MYQKITIYENVSKDKDFWRFADREAQYYQYINGQHKNLICSDSKSKS